MSQDYVNIEHIIVDGGSSDDTLSVIEGYKDGIAKVISEPDDGIYDAMNKGISIATGDVVGILNSDDVYCDNGVLSRVMAEFEDQAIDSIYADLKIVSRDDTSKEIRIYDSKKFDISKFRWGWMPPHPTFFIRKRCYDQFGLYKTDYKVAADFELLVRYLLCNGVSSKRLPRTIVKMRDGGASNRGVFWKIHQNREIVKACRENNVYTNLLMMTFKVPFKLLEYISFR
ncbi:glycosyltransferase family 2 protein [Microbulbifer echini]